MVRVCYWCEWLKHHTQVALQGSSWGEKGSPLKIQISIRALTQFSPVSFLGVVQFSARLSGSRSRSRDCTILRVMMPPPIWSGSKIGEDAGAGGALWKSVGSRNRRCFLRQGRWFTRHSLPTRPTRFMTLKLLPTKPARSAGNRPVFHSKGQIQSLISVLGLFGV